MKNIKKLRLYKGMTQKDLGILLGIKQHTICKYENTGYEIGLQTLKRLSVIFNVPIDVLIDEEIDIIAYIKERQNGLHSIEENIMSMIRKLDGSKLKQLMVFLHEISQK